MKRFFFIIFLFVFVFGCKKDFEGELEQNQAPETYTIVDTIQRSGDQRFPSSLEIKWWGTDPDGFVTGYEISADGINWKFTTRQDTILVVEIPGGKDTFDFKFSVRAIDNKNLNDPTPATLTYPVKNSNPEVNFVYSTSTSGPARNPVITFPVTRWSWSVSDPDGISNLSHVEIVWNDTNLTATQISKVYSSATLEATDWTAGTTSAKIYPGSQQNALNEEVTGLKLNDTNILYIRAADNVGAKSNWKASYKIFIKKPESKILIVNAQNTRIEQVEEFYKTNLSSAGITKVDVTRVREVKNNNYTELAPDNFTQSLIFKYFDALIWFGNLADYTLSLAQRTTEPFINKGGKIFIATNFSSAIEEQAGFLEFTPIDSLVNPPSGSQFRLNVDAPVKPKLTNLPTLKSQKIVSSARPFFEEFNSIPLYEAEITRSSGTSSDIWVGKSVVMAMRAGQNGKPQFIISSLELDNLNGNNNMADLFTKLFVEMFELK